MKDYITIKEVAEKWGVTPRRVQRMCMDGRIAGVTKFGRDWAIPADAEKPRDERITSGKFRNWRKKQAMSSRGTGV